MEREKESISNHRGESKGEEQTRLAEASLRSCQGSFPEVGTSTVTPQSALVKESAPTMPVPVPTSDGVLNWAGGEGFITPGGPPFDSELARVCGVGNLERSTVDPNPTGPHFPGPPQCLESNSGRHLNTQDILDGNFWGRK